MKQDEFIKDYNGYFGDDMDNLKQLTRHCFSGEELMDFINHLLSKQPSEASELEQSKKEIDKWSDRWAETNNQLDEVKKERDELREGVIEIDRLENSKLITDAEALNAIALVIKSLTPTKESPPR